MGADSDRPVFRVDFSVEKGFGAPRTGVAVLVSLTHQTLVLPPGELWETSRLLEWWNGCVVQVQAYLVTAGGG